MRFSTIIALATAVVGQAAAMSISHNHAAVHRRAHEVSHTVEKRGAERLHYAEVKKLSDMGVVSPGINDCEANGNVWIGADGPYTNTFHNHAGEPIILIVWGNDGSWVNSKQPLITSPIAAGDKKTLSFANGASGAWAAIHHDSQLVNGQVHETWGEFTFSNYGVVDVSREVNMKGKHMRIKGPQCTTDMEQCVFVCTNGADSCWQQYELHNCSPQTQPGAQYGEYYGAPSGGCGGLGDSAHLTTYFGHKDGF